mmetsp:Transcript_111856/g.311316  ORF Transcript_111856/g.311316 Transcript_111856/m.311316 type:complete len:244 (+) Transcript_111856:1105-1836(+)
MPNNASASTPLATASDRGEPAGPCSSSMGTKSWSSLLLSGGTMRISPSAPPKLSSAETLMQMVQQQKHHKQHTSRKLLPTTMTVATVCQSGAGGTLATKWWPVPFPPLWASSSSASRARGRAAAPAVPTVGVGHASSLASLTAGDTTRGGGGGSAGGGGGGSAGGGGGSPGGCKGDRVGGDDATVEAEAVASAAAVSTTAPATAASGPCASGTAATTGLVLERLTRKKSSVASILTGPVRPDS